MGAGGHLQADVERGGVIGHEQSALDFCLALTGLAVVLARCGRPRAQRAVRARRLLRRRSLHFRQVLKERITGVCNQPPLALISAQKTMCSIPLPGHLMADSNTVDCAKVQVDLPDAFQSMPGLQLLTGRSGIISTAAQCML